MNNPLFNKQPNLKIGLINIFVQYLLFSCSSEQLKTVEFEDIQITIPKNWNLKKGEGIDSGIWFITSTNNDTIFIDYGKYADSFEEVIQVRDISRKKEYDSLGIKYPKKMVFSETSAIDEAQGLYLKEYFYYDTISGKKAKLGFPKFAKKGRCLLHIPKIDNQGNKLSIYISNADEPTQKQILNIFKSIRFKSSKQNFP
ncbi:MAG: hypothetical protein U0X91_26015 [Spirosomataceae bacterium]